MNIQRFASRGLLAFLFLLSCQLSWTSKVSFADNSGVEKVLGRARGLIRSFPQGDPLRSSQADKTKTYQITKDLCRINDELCSLGPAAIPDLLKYAGKAGLVESELFLIQDVLSRYRSELVALWIAAIKESTQKKQAIEKNSVFRILPIIYDKLSFEQLLPLAQSQDPLLRRNAQYCLLQMICSALRSQSEQNYIEYFKCGADSPSARIPESTAVEILKLTPAELLRQQPTEQNMSQQSWVSEHRASAIMALGMVDKPTKEVIGLLENELSSRDLFAEQKAAAIALGRIVYESSKSGKSYLAEKDLSRIVNKLRFIAGQPYFTGRVAGAKIGLYMISAALPQYRDLGLELIGTVKNQDFTAFTGVEVLRTMDASAAQPYLKVLSQKDYALALSSLGPKFKEKTLPLLQDKFLSDSESVSLALMELGPAALSLKPTLIKLSAEQMSTASRAASAVLGRLDFADCKGAKRKSSCHAAGNPDYYLFKARYGFMTRRVDSSGREPGVLYRQALLKYKSGLYDRTLMGDAVRDYAALLKSEKLDQEANAMLAEFRASGTLSKVPRSERDLFWCGYR